MLKPSDAIGIVKDQLWPGFQKEKERLNRIDRWYRHDPEEIRLPRSATWEIQRLRELAKTPILGLTISVASQATLVDGYRSPDQPDNAGPWRTWEGNDFDSRQVALHRATYAYGYAYNLILPGVAPDGTSMAKMRGRSPRKMFAVFADPADDDWPIFAMNVEDQPGGKCSVQLIDDEFVYYLGGSDDASKMDFIEWREHGAGVTPVVRYANRLDLEGRATGEIEPFIPLAARLNKTDFDRLLAQHYSSWQVRYATGMAKPDDEDEARREKLRLRQDDLLIAEDPDTKFGSLPATPLGDLLKAHDSDIETIAAVTQTPTDALTGQLINMSAEALAAARAQLDQKIGEGKTGLGKSHAQSLRLAAHLEGNEEAAQDIMARITWQDTSIRSLAAAADGLGKLATQLGVPVEGLWSMIPGVDKSTVEEWRTLAAQGDEFEKFGTLLERQAAGLVAPADAGA